MQKENGGRRKSPRFQAGSPTLNQCLQWMVKGYSLFQTGPFPDLLLKILTFGMWTSKTINGEGPLMLDSRLIVLPTNSIRPSVPTVIYILRVITGIQPAEKIFMFQCLKMEITVTPLLWIVA